MLINFRFTLSFFKCAKRPPVTLDIWLDGPRINISLPGIERRILGRPTHCPVTIITASRIQSSGILHNAYFKVKGSLSPFIRVSVFGKLFIWSIEENKFHSKNPSKGKVNFTLKQTTSAQKVSRGIALLFL